MISLLLALSARADDPATPDVHPSEVVYPVLHDDGTVYMEDFNARSRTFLLRPDTEFSAMTDVHARSAAATVRWDRRLETEADVLAAEVLREWLLADPRAPGEAVEAAVTPDAVRITWAGPGDRTPQIGARALSWAEDPLLDASDGDLAAMRERVVARYADRRVDTWGRRFRVLAPQLFGDAAIGFRPGPGWTTPPVTRADVERFLASVAGRFVVVSGPESTADWPLSVVQPRVVPRWHEPPEVDPPVIEPPEPSGPDWDVQTAEVEAPTLLIGWSIPTLVGSRRAGAGMLATFTEYRLQLGLERHGASDVRCGTVLDQRAAALICTLTVPEGTRAKALARHARREAARPITDWETLGLRNAYYLDVFRLLEPWPPGASSRTAVAAAAMSESQSGRPLTLQLRGASEIDLNALVEAWIRPERARATLLSPAPSDGGTTR